MNSSVYFIVRGQWVGKFFSHDCLIGNVNVRYTLNFTLNIMLPPEAGRNDQV